MESVKNWPLLWKVYDHIVAHPEEWNQDWFGAACDAQGMKSCGTSFCFAGTAVHMTHDVTFDADGEMVIDGHPEEDGPEWDVEYLARQELGLTEDISGEIFYNFTKNPNDIREILERWEDDERVS